MSEVPTSSAGPVEVAAVARVGRGGRALRLLLGSAFVVVAVLVVTPLLGASTHRVGPGMVEVGFVPRLEGRTTLDVPPLGAASAPTHRGPVDVRLSLRSLDVGALVSDDGRVDQDELRRSIAADLRSALPGALGRFALAGALLGLVAAAVLPRRRARSLVAGFVGGAVVAGALGASAVPGFDAAAFDRLTFEGPISSGREALAALSSPAGPVGERVAVLSDKLVGLYSAALTEDVRATSGEVVILHISDLHLNPVGAQLARSLATSFEVDAVLDTGDTTSFGTDFEGAYAALLADFPVPYLFVAGNHDSQANRAAIAATPGVVPIGGTSVTVGDVEIAGFDDPVITTTERVTLEERNRRERAAEPELRRLVERTSPDLLAVHDPIVLSAVTGRVGAAVAGHGHRVQLGASKGTVVWTVGSTGATGLGSLLVEADLPASAALLRFRDGELVAIDELEVTGTRGDLLIRRRVITDELRAGETAGFIGDDIDEGRGPERGDEDLEPEPDRSSTTSAGN